jgi:TIR domain
VATRDFFISYTSADLPWAEWIAWELEAAGYTTLIQAWDFRPGTVYLLRDFRFLSVPIIGNQAASAHMFFVISPYFLFFDLF